LELDENFQSEINAHDIFSILLDRLEPMDQSILRALADGLTDSESADRLQVSVGRIQESGFDRELRG